MKRRIMVVLAAAAAAAGALAGAGAAGARPFTARDMATLDRVAAPRVSPDGHWLAYAVRSTDWAGNRGVNALWILDLSALDAAPRKLGEGSNPRWSPDGQALYFLSSRSKTSEIWRTTPQGAEPAQVTQSPVATARPWAAPPSGARPAPRTGPRARSTTS
jgi:dipeptidyl aminopeptidase/acylaminoacyl peptidase